MSEAPAKEDSRRTGIKLALILGTVRNTPASGSLDSANNLAKHATLERLINGDRGKLSIIATHDDLP
jgi:hypothetical protein